MKRVPVVLVLVVLLAGLLFLERTGDRTEAEAATIVVGGPQAPVGEGERSTWYCSAGFTTPDASNDHQVIVTNDSDQVASGQLTVFPSLPNTLGDMVPIERAVQPLQVAPRSQSVVSLAPLVSSLDERLQLETGSFVAALGEFETGGVSVAHAIVTPAGRDAAPCATSASNSWWFASGTTTNEVQYQLYLLNPFPDDAVVDISFVTDGGIRTPSRFDGRLIPRQSVTMLDISAEVPVWDQVTTEITTRTGRVVAERVQLFRDPGGPIGVSLTPGVNEMSEQWFFPAGGALLNAAESYVIFNPTDEAAEVEFELKPDSADRVGDIAPFGLPIGANERWVVTVSRHGTHPVSTVAELDATNIAAPGERYFVSVRSFNGVPVVAERVLTRPIDTQRGVATSFGITMASTDQVLAVPVPLTSTAISVEAAAQSGELAILNPAGDTISRVEIWVGRDDAAPLMREQVELAPRRRANFDLATLLRDGDRWIRIVSSTGTMAELVIGTDTSIVSLAATPSVHTTSVPDLLSFD